MSAQMSHSDAPSNSANVRLVVVDGQRRPRYLEQAEELEKAILGVAAAAGVMPQDMSGLHGMCVEAFRRVDRNLG